MNDESELWSICVDILTELYEEAEPGLDFEDVEQNPDEYPDDWYTNHELPKRREQEIVEKHLDKHDLDRDDRARVTMTAVLNYGPSYPSDGENNE